MQTFTNTDIEINTMSDNASTTSTLSGTSTPTNSTIQSNDKKKMDLINKYGTGKTLEYNKSTMQTINRAVRKVLLPRMKFLTTSKHFGSFDQPDFTDENCWVHRVFNQLGSLKNVSDNKKAEIWMTYRMKMKEQFSLHRSSVTVNLKAVFLKGASREVLCLLLKYIH